MTYRHLLPVTAVLLLGLAGNVHAQTHAQPPEAWRTFIDQQLAQSLEDPALEVRQKALEQVIKLRRTYGTALDLTQVVPKLAAIYVGDPDPQCRLAAVVGLQVLGDEVGMEHLWMGLHRQQHRRVQYAALMVLLEFYGADAFQGATDLAALGAALHDYYQSGSGPLSHMNPHN